MFEFHWWNSRIIAVSNNMCWTSTQWLDALDVLPALEERPALYFTWWLGLGIVIQCHHCPPPLRGLELKLRAAGLRRKHCSQLTTFCKILSFILPFKNFCRPLFKHAAVGEHSAGEGQYFPLLFTRPVAESWRYYGTSGENVRQVKAPAAS